MTPKPRENIPRTKNDKIVLLKATKEPYKNLGVCFGYEDEEKDSSFFVLMEEDQIEAGCKKLQDDIKSGAINKILEEYKKKVYLYGGSLIIYGQKP